MTTITATTTARPGNYLEQSRTGHQERRFHTSRGRSVRPLFTVKLEPLNLSTEEQIEANYLAKQLQQVNLSDEDKSFSLNDEIKARIEDFAKRFSLKEFQGRHIITLDDGFIMEVNKNHSGLELAFREGSNGDINLGKGFDSLPESERKEFQKSQRNFATIYRDNDGRQLRVTIQSNTALSSSYLQ